MLGPLFAWVLGAEEVYFYGYDGHLFELHAGTLEERLEAYSKGD